MKEKIKITALVAMFTVLMAAPVFSARAADGDFAQYGITVCGHPDQEEKVINELYNLRYDQFKSSPNPEQAYRAAIAQKMAEFEETSCKLSDIFVQIARITNFLIGVVAVFVVFKIVDAGFALVTSYGDEAKVKGAKEGMTNAIIGLAIVFAAFAVVNTIFGLFQVQLGANASFSTFNPFNLF